jgi:hypothetical protein
MVNFNLIASFFISGLGFGIMGFALGHAQIAYLEAKGKL